MLQVAASYFPFMGGVETHVYEVSRRMAAEGVDVTVLSTDRSGELPVREVVEGVSIRRVRAWPANRDYYIAPGIYRAVARGRWDIVHCQGYHTFVPPIAMLAAWRSKTPFVLTFHSGGHSSRWRNSIRKVQWAALRPLLSHAEKLIGVSNFEADAFRQALRLPRDRFSVVPNGNSLPILEPIERVDESEGTLIASVGRLERYKGHDRAIKAMPAILAGRPDAHLAIVGSGPYEAQLTRLSHQLAVSERVEIGPIPPSDRAGMASLLRRASLVVLFSEYEAHPVSVLEAIGMDRPVLVTYTSGLGELADRGLVRSIPMNSSSEQIANAVLAELHEPILRGPLVLPTWDQCTAELVRIYREVIGVAWPVR